MDHTQRPGRAGDEAVDPRLDSLIDAAYRGDAAEVQRLLDARPAALLHGGCNYRDAHDPGRATPSVRTVASPGGS